jgi:cytochrome P450
VAAEDVEGVARAVEELLRWDSPVQIDARIAHEDTEVAGIPVSEGDEIMTLLGAANRDPEHYRDPGRLDVRRAEGPPMSFGSGIHLCLGASLARLEGQVVLQGMLARFRTIDLRSDDIRYRDRITLRGLVELPVGLVAA